MTEGFVDKPETSLHEFDATVGLTELSGEKVADENYLFSAAYILTVTSFMYKTRA